MSSGPSKVIVLDPDPRAGRQVQLGFEREGVPVVTPAIPAEPDQLATLDWDGEPAGIVLVGGTDARAVELVRRAKQVLQTKGTDVPIVFTGHGASRPELEAAGADEVLARPTFLRDVVTIGRILRGVPSGQRDHLVGSLVETTGVLTLVRALSALGRSAVLTLIRGLRRGEVRFFHGEVTSAQVGLIHGQAALHQLLLWTDARFDFAHEDVVRRQQIPLSPEELYADAEQFLEGVREHAGQLSPASVLEQDVMRVQALGKQIPTEVHGVLRMFDGHRVLADILEDSPYRVFETLRVTQKAVEAGLLKPVDSQRPKATWRAVLAIEEWLVGSETRDAVVERTAALDSGPVAPKRKGKGKRRSKKMKAVTPPETTRSDIDWGALVPRVIGAEVGPLSGVVPAQETHGEVELPTRDKPREGLEALMDTDKRQKIFPTDIGLEPKVVVSSDTGEWEKVELEAKKRVAEEEAAAQKAKADAYVIEQAAAKAKADATATDVETAPGRKKKSPTPAPGAVIETRSVLATADTPPTGSPTVKPPPAEPTLLKLDAPKAADAADAKATREPQAREEADAKATQEATRSAAAEEAREYAARVKAAAEAKRLEAEREAEDEARGTAAETKRLETERKAADGTAAEAKRLEPERKAADAADEAKRLEAERKAADATAAEANRLETERKAADDAAAEAKRLETERKAADAAAEAKRLEAERKTADAAAEAKRLEAERKANDDARANADQEARAAAAQTTAAPVDVDTATMALVAVPTYVAPMKSDPVAAVTAVTDEPSAPRQRRAGATDAQQLIRALVAEAVPPAQSVDAVHTPARDESEPADTSASGPAPKPSLDSRSEAITQPIRPIEDAVTTPFAKPAATLDRPAVDERTTTFEKPTITPTFEKPTIELTPTFEKPTVEPTPAFERPAADDVAAKPTAPLAEPIAVAEAPATAVGVTASGTAVTATPRVLISETPSVSAVASTSPAPSAPSSADNAQGANAAAGVEPSTPPNPAATIEAAHSSSKAAEVAASGEIAVKLAAGVPTSVADIASTPKVAPTAAQIAAVSSDATPVPTEDEPSDGVVRAVIAAADTARLARGMRPPPGPEHDGPPIKETTGEIREQRRSDGKEPAVSEPSILVSDLAAAHDAVAAAAAKPAAPPPADAASPSRELEVSDVRRDAVAFSETEEAFFKKHEKSEPVPRIESFDDLDEGYQPQGFWDRVFGRNPKKP